MANTTKPGFFEMLIERLKSNSPKFYKVLAKYASYISVVGGILMGLPEVTALPEIYQEIGSYILAFFAAVALTANTTTTSPIIQEKSEKAVQ